MIPLVGRLFCLKSGHARSEKHIRRTEDGGYVSICGRCRVPMKRLAKRQWVVIPRSERGRR